MTQSVPENNVPIRNPFPWNFCQKSKAFVLSDGLSLRSKNSAWSRKVRPDGSDGGAAQRASARGLRDTACTSRCLRKHPVDASAPKGAKIWWAKASGELLRIIAIPRDVHSCGWESTYVNAPSRDCKILPALSGAGRLIRFLVQPLSSLCLGRFTSPPPWVWTGGAPRWQSVPFGPRWPQESPR